MSWCYTKLRKEISIHAPTRGATGWKNAPVCKKHDFNPRSHKGSDMVNGWKGILLRIFQSTLPQGERQRVEWLLSIETDFNPRSHKGSDQKKYERLQNRDLFQSTLPQGERRAGCFSLFHARHFNPRSHKGSDLIPMLLQPCICVFQSTLPQGERRQWVLKQSAIYKISIHAPTRGATIMKWRRGWNKWHFNPRSHKGSDVTRIRFLYLL